jgi:hypothetical protein
MKNREQRTKAQNTAQGRLFLCSLFVGSARFVSSQAALPYKQAWRAD